MSPKKRMKLKDFVQDVWAGMNNLELMQKYNLTANELRRAFQKLIDIESVDFTALYREPVRYDSPTADGSRRECPRRSVAFEVPIYEVHSPAVKGMVRDITEEGVGVSGIKAAPGELKTFVVVPAKLKGLEKIEFDAECRWAGMQTGTNEPVGGFQIKRISQEHVHVLRKLVGYVTICD